MMPYRGGRLFVEDVPVEAVVRRVGTPAYIYSSASIRSRYAAADRALRGRDHLVCYALKVNTNGAVCRILAALGAGAEAVSGGELRIALRAGFPPGKIVFSGVGKTSEEIRLALKADILALTVESEEELEETSRIARGLGKAAPVSIRLDPNIDAGTHRHLTTGRAQDKFGVDARTALAMYRKMRGNRSLLPVGLHCHIGSQITRMEPYRKAFRAMEKVLRAVESAGISLRFVDLGGGMGVDYGDGRKALDIARFGREALEWLKHRPALKLLIEPGRCLMADGGMLVTRVLYRKTSGAHRWVIVDAGMNDMMRPALYGAYHPIEPIKKAAGPRVRLDVGGPVCESADRFAKGRLMPWPARGDLWAILKTGANGFCMASQYNSRPRPAEVLVDGRKWRIIRHRESFEDLVRRER